jgi:hypothetical protein
VISIIQKIRIRSISAIAICLATLQISAQDSIIYKQTFSDMENFDIITSIGYKKPTKVFVIDTTMLWFPTRFWIEGITGKSQSEIEKLHFDEHDPYEHTYIFRDTSLKGMVTDSEKFTLSQKAALSKSRKISIYGKKVSTVQSAKRLVGLYVTTTTPLYSSDGNYAFIDMHICYKDALITYRKQDIIGTVFIIYQKDINGNWKKFKKINYLYG